MRVDANGAFTPEEVMIKLERLADFDIHSIEQPIAPGQWDALQYLCMQSPIPIALDEELIDAGKRKSKSKKDTNDEDLETLVQERTKQMFEDHQSKSKAQNDALTKLQAEHDSVMDQFHTSTLTAELSVALDGTGNLQNGARMIINDMAKKVWSMQDGNWVPRDPSTGNIMYGSDGSSPMTIKEWIPTVRKQNSFLWNDSQGGGAVGSTNRNFSNVDVSKLSPQEQLSAYYSGKT